MAENGEDMAADRTDTVLSRKARAARAQTEARVMSPARGLRLALERAVARLLSLPLAVTGIERLVADPASVPEMIADGALMMLVDGPEGADRGALAIDPGLTAALVEAQTTGTVGAGASSARAPTRTDAALCAPLFDAVLTRFAANMEDGPDAAWTVGHATGPMQAAPHLVRAALMAERYHVFRVSLGLGEGGREGGFVMALPVVAAAATEDGTPPAARPPDPRWQARVLGTRIHLDAVLCRIEMPVSEVMALRPGDTLPIAREALHEVALDPGDGRAAARARLGQMRGRRALRLSAAPASDNGGTAPHEWIAAGLGSKHAAPPQAPDAAGPEAPRDHPPPAAEPALPRRGRSAR